MTLEERAFRKATRRLIPFLFLIYVVAYLDRVNVSFAQLQLEDDLGFSDTIFGLGAGIFSLGYVLFGVPSGLALNRFGARRWLAAIMVVWGVLSAATMFIEGAAGFYVLRFLLGVAEAGFFPGIILYLTWWFPERERTRVLALFLTAIAAPPTWPADRSRARCSSSTAWPASTAGSGCSWSRACPPSGWGWSRCATSTTGPSRRPGWSRTSAAFSGRRGGA